MAVALLAPAAARADDSHYQNLLAGERGTGLGGAFTAIADDPSGNYYNPAGLVDTKGSIVSASFALYGVQTGAIAQAFSSGTSGFDGLVSNFGSVFQQVVTVPGMAGSVNGFGPKDSEGRYRHAFALSVMVLDDEATSFGQTSIGPSSLSDLTQNETDESTWLAAGYAYRIDRHFSVGLSANAVYRSLRLQSRTIEGSGVTGQTASTFTLDESLTALQVLGIFAEAGVLWRPTARWSFGLALATPSLTVYGSGQSNQVAAASASGLTDVPQTSLPADTELPVHGRVGAAVHVGPSTTLAADLSVWGPASYDLIGNAAQAISLQSPNLVTQVTRRPVVNADVGAEGSLGKRWALRGGLFTNFSSAPPLDSGLEPQLEAVNTYGATFSATLPSSKETETTIGAVYSYGQGQAKLPTAPTPTITPATISNFAIFVGGSYEF
ncbi:MAG TPA: hypothetical protein VMB50_04975 [Myxococcales bacterium]|nr:hypothetical protein [Myxococcales bacterium]